MVRNGVMMQFFEWYLPNHGNLWKIIKNEASHLHKLGVTALWIPPAYKAISQENEGYATYDLYDLGEFRQKGTVRTKYGKKRDLKKMVSELHRYDINIYLDAVMNHKAGADYAERCLVKEVNPHQRHEYISGEYEIEGMTGFTFPGRRNNYSDFKWNKKCFSGLDYDKKTNRKGVFQIVEDGKTWNDGVDKENGNYDYLMFANLDFSNPEVVGEMNKWGIWVTKELNLDGMRLDAVKHIKNTFIKEFLETIRSEYGESFYAVGEYWTRNINILENYLNAVSYSFNLFDVPLHYNLFDASRLKRNYNLSTLLDNTLVTKHPELAVTFVDNHDSQKGCSLESEIEEWFKPSAYALILLMKDGYPCLFYGDYYGIRSKKSSIRTTLDLLMKIRRQYAFGEQINYFDHPGTVGLIRLGDDEYPGSGLALLISNGDDGKKNMYVGKNRAGECWFECSGDIRQEVVIDEKGYGTFYVNGGTFAVWVHTYS